MRKEARVQLGRRKFRNILMIFIPAIFFFGFITTAQLFIIGNYIDYRNIARVDVVLIFIFWFLCALAFTFITTHQFNKNIEKPMQVFAKATNQVANGDFSVYVEPIHSSDKLDYLDYMFLDFNKMVEELGSIETMKSDVISNVSHEIKTPIAVIQNYAEYLQKGNIREEQRIEYAKSIEDTTKRLANLVTNILRLNKLENQQMNPEALPYDVCRQLSECAIQYEEIWEKKNIEFEADMEDNAWICGDKSLMELVWNNLISNAIKFTNNGGKVILKQYTMQESIMVSVSDNGCGMNQDTIKHIFDKFYQGDSSHSKEGNGLGLALALRVLQLHDGTIDVSSTLGKGTTFSIRMPIYKEENCDKKCNDREIYL